MQALTLRSTEHRTHVAKHEVRVLAFLPGHSEPEKMLVEVSPPIPAGVYATDSDLERLVLAPRLEGTALAPSPSELPLRVYVLLPEGVGDLEHGPYRIADWGLLEASRPE